MARSNRRRSRIDTNDLAGYGSVAHGTVDVDRAARGLGVSKTEVRQALRRAEAAQGNMFYRRISGKAEGDSTEGTSMRGMLQAVFGRGPRGAAVDARAAAKSLGVSPVTVRRWVAGTQQPLPGRLAAIRQAARRVTTTKKGRRGTTADFRASTKGGQALKDGSKIWVSGEQGVGGYSQGYARDRRVATDISPSEIEAMLRAYEDGGDSGLRDWMTQFFDDKYVSGWDFVTIDDFGIGTRVSPPKLIRPVRGPRWTRKRLIAMLLDCYGPTPRGAVDVASVAHYAAVSPSTVRRWLAKRPDGSRRMAIPKHRLIQLQRGPAEVERRNEQQYQHALAALRSIDDERSILPAWREQRWLDQHTVAILAIHQRPWLQVAVTNGSRRALGEMHRRGATVDNLIVPTRFHAQVLAHAVMVRQQAWRVHPVAHRLSAGRTQAWMADAPAVDLAALLT